MRKARDGESTKAAVIAAAKEVFAERGFAGTSLAMISEKCGISDGLILHHFKSKKNLYHVILEELSRGYVETISQVAMTSGESKMTAQEMLRATFHYWSKDTTYNRMSMWAYLENQSELIEEEVKITAGLAAAIQQMQAQGKVDARFSPLALLTLAIGPIHFWNRYRGLFQETFQLKGTPEELNETFLEEYIALIQKVYQIE
jgi:AcrR family transcriptional regulator